MGNLSVAFSVLASLFFVYLVAATWRSRDNLNSRRRSSKRSHGG